ncbi:MAG: SpoIIE family protein phosphatase [Crocinitomicaceae bacterium]|nr:SpoIIE family protein phosphatase [Crocinitomicaceae bacterium]
MKTLIRLTINILLAFIFIGCSQEVEWDEISENEDHLDTFYLRNDKGDTLPTGEKIEVIKPANYMSWIGRTFEPKDKNAKNIHSEYHNKHSNELPLNLIYEGKFYIDSVHFSWSWNNPNDTLEHPEPIVTKGKTIPLQHVNRKRLAPPEFKEKALADIQFFSVDQGLVSSQINDILIDSRGITWIATDRGLVRYDGVHSMDYTVSSGLPSNEISCLEEGPKGELWMGFTTGGFAKFDGNHLTIFDRKSCGFSATVIDLTFDENGLLLIASFGAGLCTYDGEKIMIYDRTYGLYSHKMLDSFTKDEDGNIWFINFGGGIWRYTQEGLSKYVTTSGLQDSWLPCVFIDSKNRKWVGGANSDIHVIDGADLKRYKIESEEVSSYINCFAEDSNGNIWVGTSHYGVLKVKENSVEQYGLEQGLSSSGVSRMRFDSYGRLWVATYDGGVSIINLNSFRYMREQHGLPSNRVNGMTQMNNKTFYATDQGLVVESNDSLIWITGYEGPEHQSALRAHPNSDVISTKDGILFTSVSNFGFGRYRKDLGHLRRLGGNTGVTQNPSGVALDSNGVVYGASGERGRLYFFIDTSGYHWDYNNNFVFHSSTDVEVDHNNTVWVGSATQGLCSFDGDYWTYYTTNEGLSSNTIKDIFIDQINRVWVITNKGLDYMENGQINNTNLGDGSYNSSIQSIIQDNQGTYWIGLFDGLIELQPISASDKWDVNNYEMTLYSKNDGIVNSSFLKDAMYISNDNKLYMGTEGGLLIKNLQTSNEVDQKPSASLLSIDINSKEIDFNRVRDRGYLKEIDFPEDVVLEKAVPFYNYPTGLELPYDYNHITFHYEGSYHGAETPQRLVYEYYVEGIDDNWILGPKEQKADYRNIPYGDYKFHLRSYIHPDNPSDEFIYPFTILPPWYHTWWARILFLLLFITLTWGAIRIRTKALLARQRELEATVEERTAELKEKHEQLEESHQEIKDSIAYAKRIQSAILPPQKLVKEYLPESFILYKPKDVVAGDFYWMAHAQDKILFAAADCTGHGVPGAMVSVICNGGLNRSVNEFNLTDPGKILDKTRELVIKEFEKSEDDVKDGMDIALCSLGPSSTSWTSLNYAGANNPLWIIRKGSDEIEEVKADKQPIGKYQNASPFNTHQIELMPGDSFYIFSDGYADQFGGEKGKKFKSANFKSLLLSIQDKNMEEQRHIIDQTFEDWKNQFEQVDDVCVIGVQV